MKDNMRIIYRDIAKYFLHGIIFSILFLVLGIIWASVFVVLVVVGWIIGLIIGLALLILIVGFINTVVTSFLWFPVKSSFWDLLVHGLVLFIVLLVPDVLVVLIPLSIFPGVATLVITRIIISFLYGFIGKKVAGFWEETAPSDIPPSVEVEWRDRNL